MQRREEEERRRQEELERERRDREKEAADEQAIEESLKLVPHLLFNLIVAELVGALSPVIALV